MTRTPTILSLLLLLLVGAPRMDAQDLLIRNGHVITITGDEIAGGHVLIRGGRIAEVGQLEAPAGVPVIDATDKVVMPGFVLAHSSGGMQRTNEMVPVVPYVSVRDALDPSQPFFEDALRDGHLTMAIMPGDRTVIGGMGMAVHPFGLTVEDMVVEPEAGIKVSLIPMGGNRAAHMARLRDALQDAQRYLEKKERDADPARDPSSGNVSLDLEALGVERRKQALVRLLKGDLVAYVSCATAGDVVQALRLEKEYGLKVRLVCGAGTWRAAPMLAKLKIPVILGPTLEQDETDPETGKKVRRIIPRIFHDAGVRFAVTSAPSSLGRRYLWYQAACLVRYGMTRKEALAAVTTIPAELIGLGDRKGALAMGRDADVIVLSDDPLSGRAWVDTAVIGGRVVYERSKDPRLAEVFGAEGR